MRQPDELEGDGWGKTYGSEENDEKAVLDSTVACHKKALVVLKQPLPQRELEGSE